MAFLGSLGLSAAAAGPAGAATAPLYAYAAGTGNPSGCPPVISGSPASECSLEHALTQATKVGAATRTVDLATAGVNPTTAGDPSHYIGNWTINLDHTTSTSAVVIQPATGLSTAPVLDGDGGVTTSACHAPAAAPDCTGSILAVSSAGYLQLSGFTMADADDTSSNGGGAIDNGDGGAGGTIALTSMTFIDDSSSNDGGAVDNGDNGGSGTLTVTSSTFTSDSAGADGGAVDSADNGGTGSLSIAGSTLDSDTAAEDGGAVDNADNAGKGSLSVSDTTLDSDTAQDGGAVDNADYAGTGDGATIASSTFEGDQSTAADGGAVDSADNGGTGSLVVSLSTFTSDSAKQDGGAVDSADNGGASGTVGLTVTSSTFTTDTAGSDGGAIDSVDNAAAQSTETATLTVSGSTFASDSASADGGAIDTADNGGSGTLTLTGSTFTSDSATFDGGAVDNGDDSGHGTLSVTGSTFTSDTAQTDGGAVDNADDSGHGTLSVTGSTFRSDTAQTDGGAIDTGDYKGTADGTAVSASTFTSDSAGADGGGIDNADNAGTGTGVTVVDSTFDLDATTGGDGGAADNADFGGTGTFTVTESTFSANAASADGGAIDDADNAPSTAEQGVAGVLTVTASTLAGNTAVTAGPAVAGGNGTVTIAGDQIADACVPATATWNDVGYDVGSATCLDAGPGDVADAALAATIGPLANNGGPTETLLPLTGNPGMALIPDPTSVSVDGGTLALCPVTDQRGTANATGTPCYAGSVQGPPDQVVITSAPLALQASSSATGAFTVTLEDHYGSPVDALVDTTVHLASSSAQGKFASASGGTAVSSVVVPSGDNAVTVYYGDRTAGLPKLTASSVGYAPGTQAESVSPGPATTFAVAAPGSGVVGTPVTVTVTAKDAFGNTASGYRGTVRFAASAGTNSPLPDTAFSAADGGRIALPVTFTSGGDRTVTATDTVTTSLTGTSGTIDVSELHGYWLVGADGGIFTFGSAQFHGSTGNLTLQRPVVGITPTSDRNGYWLVASDGGIFAFGDAGFHGSIPGIGLSPAGSPAGVPQLDAPIVGMVPSDDGGGYFMVASDGGVFAFGDARFEGSCPGIGGCSGAAVAVVPDASGDGYWLVTATGNVYTFGNAIDYGSPGSQGSVVTSAVRFPSGDGYWILFANGTVTAFGSDPVTFGSPVGSVGGADPATAIFATADGSGYWVATADGAVYNYGDAPADGGMSGSHLNAPIIAATGW
jgi:hypothetical protein